MSVKDFYKARLFRIIPLYLFTMLLFFCFRSHLHGNARLPASFTFVGFLQALFFFNDSLINLNAVVWTLKIELIFYLIFPLLGYLVFILYKKKNLVLLGAILLLLLVIPLLIRYSGKIEPKSFYCNFDSLVMGIIVAIIYSYKNEIPTPKSSFFWPFMLGIGLAIMIYSLRISDAMEKTLVTISIGIMVTSSLFWDFVYYKKILSSKILGYIALISYSLYLWHYNIYFNVAQPLAKLLPYTSKAIYNGYVILIALCVTLVLSIFTYYAIEKPFLKLKKWI